MSYILQVFDISKILWLKKKLAIKYNIQNRLQFNKPRPAWYPHRNLLYPSTTYIRY